MPCLTLTPPIEILLVDDQRAILAGVSALIESEGETMRVSGCAGSGAQALELAARLQPDVIILDVELGDEDGLELIPLLHRICEAVILVFTCHDHPAVRRRALELGAACLIEKSASGSALITAIRESLEGFATAETEPLA